MTDGDGDDDGQATLDEFDGRDDVDELRADVDRLTELVSTVAESQEDLAETVAEIVDERADRDGSTGEDPDLPEFQ